MLGKKKLGDKMPPIFIGGFIVGEIILIFLFVNLYLLTYAGGIQEAVKPNISANITAQKISAVKFPFSVQWPIQGEINQHFSNKHPGLDIQATYGAKIKPLGPGIVQDTSYKKGYGQTILINHGQNFSSLYAHLSKTKVNKNQVVGLETEIGDVGTSGWTTGSHLHLEIFEGEKRINPNNLLP